MRHTCFGFSSILSVVGCCLLIGCTVTAPVPDPGPPNVGWTFYNNTTRQSLSFTNLIPGQPSTVFINPGDEYLLVFHGSSTAGMKNITLSASGSVICNGGNGPYTVANPFTYSIGPTTITMPAQQGGQVITDASNPYGFVWGTVQIPGQPPYSGPTASALKSCGNSGAPLLGTTTYTGTAVTDANATNIAQIAKVTTCVASAGCTGLQNQGSQVQAPAPTPPTK